MCVCGTSNTLSFDLSMLSTCPLFTLNTFSKYSSISLFPKMFVQNLLISKYKKTSVDLYYKCTDLQTWDTSCCFCCICDNVKLKSLVSVYIIFFVNIKSHNCGKYVAYLSCWNSILYCSLKSNRPKTIRQSLVTRLKSKQPLIYQRLRERFCTHWPYTMIRYNDEFATHALIESVCHCFKLVNALWITFFELL